MNELIKLERLLKQANDDLGKGVAALKLGDRKKAAQLLTSAVDKLKVSETIIQSLTTNPPKVRHLPARDKLVYAARVQSVRYEIRKLKEAMADFKKKR